MEIKETFGAVAAIADQMLKRDWSNTTDALARNAHFVGSLVQGSKAKGRRSHDELNLLIALLAPMIVHIARESGDRREMLQFRDIACGAGMFYLETLDPPSLTRIEVNNDPFEPSYKESIDDAIRMLLQHPDTEIRSAASLILRPMFEDRLQVGDGTYEVERIQISRPGDSRVVFADRVSQQSGGFRWAIRIGEVGFCLNRMREWEVEPMPSSRTPEFLERCRYLTLGEALSVYESLRSREAMEAETRMQRSGPPVKPFQN